MTGRKNEPARHLREWDYSTGTGFRADPRWQAAHRAFLAAADDRTEDPDVNYRRMVVAAYDMYVLEAEHRGVTPKPMQVLLRAAGEDPTLFDPT